MPKFRILNKKGHVVAKGFGGGPGKFVKASLFGFGKGHRIKWGEE